MTPQEVRVEIQSAVQFAQDNNVLTVSQYIAFLEECKQGIIDQQIDEARETIEELRN